MSKFVSTITSKGQIYIPKEVRKDLALRVGQRIMWRLENNTLVGQPIRSISELAGCLKSEMVAIRLKDVGKAFVEASVARHKRISKQT